MRLWLGTVVGEGPAPVYPIPVHLLALPPHAELELGDPVEVIAEVPGWWLVLAGARAGWVEAARVRRDPLLIVDVYHGDVGGHPRWPALLEAPGVIGAIVKATQGTSYGPARSWFPAQWRELREVAGDRYGRTWFRGAYHFLSFDLPGDRQADYYCDVVVAAGGWDAGDLIPIVDVERGSQGAPNWDDGRAKVEACTRAFVARVKQRTGRAVCLYGNGAMRDLGIRSRMGCSALWIPRYTETLPAEMYERAGWTLDAVPLWQYCGDGRAAIHETAGGAPLPSSIPGFGAVDISVALVELAELRRQLVEARAV